MIFAWISLNGKAFPEKFDEYRVHNELSRKFFKDTQLKAVILPPEHEKLSLDELARIYPL